MKKNPYLSIIIPTFNEANRLPDSIERLYTQYLDTALHTYEVIIADDGSTDGTAEVVDTLAAVYHNLRVIRLDHRGKGHAVKKGMLAACGRWRMMADADFSMPPYEIKRLVPRPGSPSAPDILITSRETLNISVRRSPLRWLAGRVFNFLVTRITGINIPDTQCGFKVFSDRAARDLFAASLVDGFAFDVEIIMLAHESGRYSLGGMGVDWVQDPDSRVNLIPDSIKMLKDVAEIAQRLRRERRAEPETLAP